MHSITVQRQAGKEYLVQDAFNTRNCSAWKRQPTYNAIHRWSSKKFMLNSYAYATNTSYSD